MSKEKKQNADKQKKCSAEVSVGLHIDSDRKDGTVSYLLRAVIAWTGAVGSVMCFFSAINTDIGLFCPFFFSLLPILFCTAASIVRKKNLDRVIISVMLLLFVIFAVRSYDSIADGYQKTTEIYTNVVQQNYQTDGSSLTIDMSKAEEKAVISFAACVSFAIALVLGISIIYRTSIIGTFAVTFPPLELILYYGLVPGYLWTAMLLACWGAAAAAEITLYTVYGEQRKISLYLRTSAQSAAVCALIFFISFGITDAVLIRTDYQRPESANEFRIRFSNYVRDFSWDKFVNDVEALVSPNKDISGAINHGKLGRTDKIEFNNQTVLNVSLEKSGSNFYLKGFTGSVYTGNSWEELSAADEESLTSIINHFRTMYMIPEFMDGYSLYEYNKYHSYKGSYEDIDTENISITNISANKNFAYIPYFITPQTSRTLSVSGDTVSATGSRMNVSVYKADKAVRSIINDNDDWFAKRYKTFGTSEILYEDEKNYRDYVYEHYLDVPESCDIISRIYGDTEIRDTYTELSDIKKWLASHCSYSLEAGKLPFGDDFITTFIAKNRKGSCSHFASAAVMMCRTRGIPARYCEGYIIKPSDFSVSTEYGAEELLNVTDTRAHAWVEIYIDGYGWYPFEVTPGYESMADKTEQKTEAPQENINSQTVTTPTETTMTETSEKITVTTKPVETTGRESQTAVSPGKKPVKKQHRTVIIPIVILFVLFIGIFSARYIMITSRRQRVLTKGSPSAKAKCAGKYFLLLCRSIGISKTEDISFDEFALMCDSKIGKPEKGKASDVISPLLETVYGNDPPDKAKADKASLLVREYRDMIFSQMKPHQKLINRFIRCLR